MELEEWSKAITLFQSNPCYDSFQALIETLPFETMCQYPLMDESANDLVSMLLPVIEECIKIDEVSGEFIVRPSMVRICELSDQPIDEPALDDGSDRIENAQAFVGLIRTWAYSEHHPDRRSVLRNVLLMMIRIYGAVALSLPDAPAPLQKGLGRFGEWLCGIWLNMLDAENTRVATNMLDILNTVGGITPTAVEVLPRLRHFSREVIKLAHFDDVVARWLRNDLTPDEKDSVHAWVINLISPLLARVRGEATLLGSVDVSTCRVRAAVALIRLMDLSPQLTAMAEAEHWCTTITDQLYFTEDHLLKLAAGQVIIEELLQSVAGCKSLFESKVLDRIVQDLGRDTASSTAEVSKRACLRLLANVFEKVPASRKMLATEGEFVRHVRLILLNEDAVIKDLALAVSCIGALMSHLNPEGVQVVASEIPEWKAVFERCLIAGDEHETTACVMALTRIIAGVKVYAACISSEPKAVADDRINPNYIELRQKILLTVDNEFTPILIKNTYPKPYPAVRVFIYQLFEALMINWGCFGAAECYSSSPALMEQLFNCPSDKLHEVVLARHHYIRRIASVYTFQNDDFRSAVEYCATHGPHDIPPLFAGDSGDPLVEERADQ